MAPPDREAKWQLTPWRVFGVTLSLSLHPVPEMAAGGHLAGDPEFLQT